MMRTPGVDKALVIQLLLAVHAAQAGSHTITKKFDTRSLSVSIFQASFLFHLLQLLSFR